MGFSSVRRADPEVPNGINNSSYNRICKSNVI